MKRTIFPNPAEEVNSMIRIRKRFGDCNTIKYNNGLARCSPFVINPEDCPTTYLEKQYGNISSRTETLLPERSSLTFVTLLKMVDGEPGSLIECKVSEVARIRGVKNIHDEKILGFIRQDIERLLEVGFQLNINSQKPEKGKGYRGRFNLIEGELLEEDYVSLSISPHLKRIKEFVEIY